MDIIWDLNFAKSYDPPVFDAVDLKFGATTGEVVDPAFAEMDLVKAKPVIDFVMVYDSAVSRPVAGEVGARWNGATQMARPTGDDWTITGVQFKDVTSLPWERCNQLQTGMSEGSKNLTPIEVERVVPWKQATPIYPETYRGFYKSLKESHHEVVIPWSVATGASRVSLDGFQQGAWAGNAADIPWEVALALYAELSGSSQPARRLQRAFEAPWQQGRLPPQGISTLPPVKPPDPPYVYSTDLNFECPYIKPDPLAVRLNFGKHPCPGGIVIPDRKVYFIVNTLSMKRVSDNTPIELVSASVGIDKNSWCWSFSGAVPYTEFEKVEPTATGPVEVELEINGLVWRLLIEKYSTREVFAKTDISISGRSVTAWLDAPYAPVRSFVQTTALTSRQFAEAELTRAGLITGFTLDWQLVDALGWQMPANTWSYADLTPVQVIQAIAQGAGGYVNSHPSAMELIVRAEYPRPFWEWAAATADHTIPESLILSRSLDWEEKPVYNGVYVSGELTGVNDLVRRAGTNGAMQAPPFVGPMISDHAAARSKGIAILSASGKQARVGLELPMEPTLGLVTPGMLVQVQKDASNNWRGLVNSTQIGAAWGDSDSLTVSQSIELERHYGGL